MTSPLPSGGTACSVQFISSRRSVILLLVVMNCLSLLMSWRKPLPSRSAAHRPSATTRVLPSGESDTWNTSRSSLTQWWLAMSASLKPAMNLGACIVCRSSTASHIRSALPAAWMAR